jgi:hypothetical protein
MLTLRGPYCVVTDPSVTTRHDMTARHRHNGGIDNPGLARVVQRQCREVLLRSLHKLGWHSLIKRFKLRGWWCRSNNSKWWWKHNQMKLWFEGRWVLLRWFLLTCPLRCANERYILWSIQRFLYLHCQLRSANGLPNRLPFILFFRGRKIKRLTNKPWTTLQMPKMPIILLNIVDDANC